VCDSSRPKYVAIFLQILEGVRPGRRRKYGYWKRRSNKRKKEGEDGIFRPPIFTLNAAYDTKCTYIGLYLKYFTFREASPIRSTTNLMLGQTSGM